MALALESARPFGGGDSRLLPELAGLKSDSAQNANSKNLPNGICSPACLPI